MIADRQPTLLRTSTWPLMVLLLTGLVSSCAVAQQPAEQPTADELPFGFQVFHSLLESRGVQTTTDLQAVHTDPTGSMIVLLGDIDQNDLLARTRLQAFIAQGGCVLLATDRAAWVDDLCVIQRGPVLVEKQFAYQDHTDCPQVTQLDTSHALTFGVKRLIANRSGWLDRLFTREGRWQRLAELPATETDPPRILMAVMRSGESRQGRLLAVADHSLLINGMVLHGDNARFLLNLTNWLTRNDRRRLFIAVDGQPLAANGRPSALPDELPPPPLPEELPPIDIDDLKNLPSDMWLPFGNQLLTSMEDANIHNELAANRPRELSARLYRRILYFLAGAIALLLIVRQLLRGSRRVDPPVPGRHGSLLAARVEQYRRTGQLQLAMQALAADLLRSLSGSDQEGHWAAMPRQMRVDAGWLTRWRVRRALGDLVKIATDGEQSSPLPAAEFQWLSRRIAEIQRLQQQQRLDWPGT